MTWLNNGCALIVNGSSSTDDVPIIVNNPLDFDYLDEQEKNNFYLDCKDIFIQINNDKKSCEQASYEYAKLFRRVKDMNVKQLSYSICFLLLPICYFGKEKNNYRNDLVQLVQLLNKPKNKYAQLLYYLILNKTNDFGENVDSISRNDSEFSARYIQEGGTEAACKLFLEIHNVQNIDWWLNELHLYSTNLNASDFDAEMIDYVVSNEILDCDDFLLTMIITLFFHLLEITRLSIAEYALENIQVDDEYDRFIYNLLIFSKNNNSDVSGSFSGVYDIFKNSLFTVHFLNLINHAKESKVNVEKDYRLAVQRYVEFLSFDEKLIKIIPDYLASITNEKSQSVPQILQKVFPALSKHMPQDIIEKVSKLESYEKEYSLNSIQKVNEILRKENERKKTKSRENENNEIIKAEMERKDTEGKDISKFLNENFYETNQEVKLDMMKAIFKFYSLQNLKDVEESVIVDMMETCLDNDEFDDEDNKNDNGSVNGNEENVSELLEQHLFDYIAATGDLPEFGK